MQTPSIEHQKNWCPIKLESGNIEPNRKDDSIVIEKYEKSQVASKPTVDFIIKEGEVLQSFRVEYVDGSPTQLIVTEKKKDVIQNIRTIRLGYSKGGICRIESESMIIGEASTPKEVYSFVRCMEFMEKIKKGINNNELWKNYSSDDRVTLAKLVTSNKNEAATFASNTHALSQKLWQMEMRLCPNYPHSFNSYAIRMENVPTATSTKLDEKSATAE